MIEKKTETDKLTGMASDEKIPQPSIKEINAAIESGLKETGIYGGYGAGRDFKIRRYTSSSNTIKKLPEAQIIDGERVIVIDESGLYST